MQRLEVSGAVRPIYESLGVKRLRDVQWAWLFTELLLLLTSGHTGVCSGDHLIQHEVAVRI